MVSTYNTWYFIIHFNIYIISLLYSFYHIVLYCREKCEFPKHAFFRLLYFPRFFFEGSREWTFISRLNVSLIRLYMISDFNISTFSFQSFEMTFLKWIIQMIEREERFSFQVNSGNQKLNVTYSVQVVIMSIYQVYTTSATSLAWFKYVIFLRRFTTCS